MEIVLASASPRRAEILSAARVPFRVVTPRGIVEDMRGEAGEAARRLAQEKATLVAGILDASPAGAGEAVVLGADTIVEIGGRLLGKPADRGEAREMLERLSGRVHRVVTGVAVIRTGREPLVESESTEVAFRRLSPEDLESYLDSGDWEGKAGGYGIQSAGRGLVEGFRGCYLNVVGLPLRRTLRLLEAAGGGSLLPRSRACECRVHPLQKSVEGCGPPPV